MSNATLAEHALARDLAFELCRTYPGYHWGVDVDNGTVKIMNAEVSGERAYLIHLPGNYAWKALSEAVRRGAGEILERYRLSRVRRDEAEVKALVRDVRGEAVGEVE